MSFATGFVTGLADSLATGINQRTQDARDYFEKQVDYARTTGLANRNKVKQEVDKNISIAQQLQQAGVTKNIIMAQINMDPQGLASFYDQAESLRADAASKGKTLDWNTIYEVAGDFKAPDEDMASFITRTYDPISQAVNSPDYEDSPKESLIASMMGFNSMDRARRRLGETPIAEGLSAEELIRYGDIQPQRIGGRAVVTTNYENIPGKTGTPKFFSSADFKLVEEAVLLKKDEAKIAQGGDATEIRGQLLEDFSRMYPDIDPQHVQDTVDIILRNAGVKWSDAEDAVGVPPDAPTEAGEAQPVPAPTTPTPEPTMAPTEATGASTAPIDPKKEPNLATIPEIIIDGKERFLTFVLDNGDGTSTWIDQDGEEIKLQNAGARAARNS